MGRFLTTDDLDLLARVHVRQALDWADMAGTDYWLKAGPAVNGATTFLASNRGWTTTTLTITQGSAADFGSASDKGTTQYIDLGADTDLLQSPIIFGDYQAMRVAQLLMGKKVLPRYLIADVLATFGTASANEVRSGFGFVEDGGTAGTDADSLAWIHSDSANFSIKSGAATGSPVGPAVDNSPHWWRIVLDRNVAIGAANGASWYIDGTKIASFDIEADEFPVSFGAYASTTNRIRLHTVHIYYAWQMPTDLLAA